MTALDEKVQGFTLLELLVTVAVAGVLLATGVPRLAGGRFGLVGSHAQLVADLRETRTDAITHGDHFMLNVVGPTSYEIRRMHDADGDGVWTPAALAVATRTLPRGLSFTSGLGGRFEFNTRGLLSDPAAAATLVLHDARSGRSRTVTVWPSGQVAPVELPS